MLLLSQCLSNPAKQWYTIYYHSEDCQEPYTVYTCCIAILLINSHVKKYTEIQGKFRSFPSHASPVQYPNEMHYRIGHSGCCRYPIKAVGSQRVCDCSCKPAGCGNVSHCCFIVAQLTKLRSAPLLHHWCAGSVGGLFKSLTFLLTRRNVVAENHCPKYCSNNSARPFVSGLCWGETAVTCVGTLVNTSGVLITLDDLPLAHNCCHVVDKVAFISLVFSSLVQGCMFDNNKQAHLFHTPVSNFNFSPWALNMGVI